MRSVSDGIHTAAVYLSRIRLFVFRDISPKMCQSMQAAIHQMYNSAAKRDQLLHDQLRKGGSINCKDDKKPVINLVPVNNRLMTRELFGSAFRQGKRSIFSCSQVARCPSRAFLPGVHQAELCVHVVGEECGSCTGIQPCKKRSTRKVRVQLRR